MDKVFGAGKMKNRVFALVFALVWGGLVLFNFVMPAQSFSQAENRVLASFPKYTTARLLDGDFMEDMNTYLNDQFVGRQYWVSGQSLLEYGLGKRELNGVYVAGDALYRHYPPENAAVSEANVKGINAFAEQYDIPTRVMLIPSSTYTHRDQLPLFATSWDEGAFIRQMYGGLLESIEAIDLIDTLSGQSPEPVYYRTDHHWTSYGAWLGYQQYAERAGLPQRESELVTSLLSTDFLGTNHSRTGFPLVQPDTMELYQIGDVVSYETYGIVDGDYVSTEFDSMYFPEFLEQKDKYSYFLGYLQAYVTIHTGADTDRTLIIFKDSYAHCFVPMLMADYSEIRLVDLRSLNADDYGAFVEAQRYDEALFLYSTDTFSQQIGPARLAP